MKRLNYTNLPIIIIFILYFFIGYLIFDDYGISYDEHQQRINGFVYLNLIRKIFLLDIYPNLEHPDNILGKSAIMYGVIFDLPMAFIEKKFQFEDSRNYFLLRHFFNFLIFFVSSICFYLTLKLRFSKKLSTLGLFFFILSPRIFADSFYNNKDIIFLSFFVISLFFTISFLNNPTYKNAILSALTCAFAISSRVLGIIVPFVFIIFFLFKSMDNKTFFKQNISKVIIFFFLLIFTVILCWPYLWNSPLTNFIDSLITHSSHPWRGSVFYFGKYISALNLPWHYPIIWILISTPILYLFLFILGSILISVRISKRFLNLSNHKKNNDLWMGNKERMDVIFFIIFYFTLILVIELNATLYGGWRHLYFIYPCLVFISIRGCDFLVRSYSSKYVIFFCYAFIIYIGIWTTKNHPFQFVYFNKLAGEKVENYFELDYWGTSNKSALNFIAKIDSRNKINIFVHSNSPYHFNLSIINKNDRDRLNFVNNDNNADYLVTNHHYLEGNPSKINKELKKKFKLIKEFKVDKIVVNSIYKIN